MIENRTCPECQTPLADDAPSGLCPRCLLQCGLGSDTSGPTTAFGPFTPPSVDELRPLFSQLEILELLGQGGMGAVYKARQLGLDRLVALKILPAADASFAERFTREARTLAKLNHPGIVTIFDFGQAGGFYYFVMEFVEGVNLRQAQHAHKLTPAEALAIVPKICEALQVAHDAGVVHRDIKPENILLDAKGRVKIADFGLAKLLHRDPEHSHLTGTHQAMGTMHYMAPEQWEKPLTVDHRADIYSLGVVFYELLTGELPLGRFAPPSQKVQVDVRIDEVVLRTLEKEPDRRYQHASDVKTDVEKARNKQKASLTEPIVGTQATENRVKLLLDETDRTARRLQHSAGFIGILFVGMGLLFTAIAPNAMPVEIAIIAVGVFMLVVAARTRQQWEVDYLGHIIRFENAVFTSGRLMIDARDMASGGVGLSNELSARITSGPGAGDRIVARTQAGLLTFRLRLFAEPAAISGASKRPDADHVSSNVSKSASTMAASASAWQAARSVLVNTTFLALLLCVYGLSAGIQSNWSLIPQFTQRTSHLVPSENSLNNSTAVREADALLQSAISWSGLNQSNSESLRSRPLNLYFNYQSTWPSQAVIVILAGLSVVLVLFGFKGEGIPLWRPLTLMIGGGLLSGLLFYYSMTIERHATGYLLQAYSRSVYETGAISHYSERASWFVPVRLHDGFTVPLGASMSLCAIGVWQLVRHPIRKKATTQPLFLRLVLWPVLALIAIAVVSAGVSMTQSFGSLRGPAQIVNSFSSFLAPVVFVSLMIRWMWLTVRPQSPSLFWVFTGGLTLVLAVAMGAAGFLILLRSRSDVGNEQPNLSQQLLIGNWTWIDGRIGTSEFRADGTFEERFRETIPETKRGELIDLDNQKFVERDGLLRGQYRWTRSGKSILVWSPGKPQRELGIVVTEVELTIKEIDGGVHRMKRFVPSSDPRQIAQEHLKTNSIRNAIVGRWQTPMGWLEFHPDKSFAERLDRTGGSPQVVGTYYWDDDGKLCLKGDNRTVQVWSAQYDGNEWTLRDDRGITLILMKAK